MVAPVSAVLTATDAGARTLAEICAATALSADVARGVVEHLVRLGKLQSANLASVCPASGCGSCASACSTGPVSLGMPQLSGA